MYHLEKKSSKHFSLKLISVVGKNRVGLKRIQIFEIVKHIFNDHVLGHYVGIEAERGFVDRIASHYVGPKDQGHVLHVHSVLFAQHDHFEQMQEQMTQRFSVADGHFFHQIVHARESFGFVCYFYL
jgi:hypothetical protein